MIELRAVLRADDYRDGKPIQWISVAFHPTVPTLYGLGMDHRTAVWDVPSGQPVQRIGQTSDWIITQAISPDGTLLAVGSADHVLVLWDLARNEPRFSMDFDDHVAALAFSPDGMLIATGHYGAGPVRVWRVADGRHIATVAGGDAFIKALAFSPNGAVLAIAATWNKAGEETCLWSVRQRRRVARVPHESEGPPLDTLALAFHPSGRLLAVADATGRIRLWDATTGTQAAAIDGHRGKVRSIAYDPAGILLASGGADSTLRLWDGTTGAPYLALSAHDDAIVSVAFSPDGTYLASASLDRTVKLWTSIDARDHPGC